MARVSVFHDREGNSLTVWLDDPSQEYVCEETGEEVVLMKDKNGGVIGFEKPNFISEGEDPLRVAFETVASH